MGNQEQSFSLTFGDDFLEDYAGAILTDVRVAIVELIANAYDAGALMVDILWPKEEGEVFRIADDGCGMTSEQFDRRWKMLSYNRRKEQGSIVLYPPGVRGPAREAFGQSGKGRHGAFAFADQYEIETWCQGEHTHALVERVSDGGLPFRYTIKHRGKKEGHGTVISGKLARPVPTFERLIDFVGSKFLVDPSLAIVINGQRLELLSLKTLQSETLRVPEVGTIEIHLLDGLVNDRNTKLRGVTWWVQKRMVGHPSWEVLGGDGPMVDGRTNASRRYSFVVEADILKPHVKGDWSSFRACQATQAVQEAVYDYVQRSLLHLQSGRIREKKRTALIENGSALKELSANGRRAVSSFIDEIVVNCPTLSDEHLNRTVQIFTNMEKARTGYDLLQQLSQCSPDDLDTWNRLMRQWTASTAEVVLNELGRRLDLIKKLQKLVNTKTTDELHQLQPLFGRGLWMFGPEFESVEFASNRFMATVIAGMLGGSSQAIEHIRADFVALPDRSIGVYSADGYDQISGEVHGFRKVLVVELKRGGFKVTKDELRQGEDYAVELQKAEQIGESTEIVVYVLGSALSDDARKERKVDNIRTVPMVYDSLLQRANARTFNLQRKLESVTSIPEDELVSEVLREIDLQTSLELTDCAENGR